MGLHPVDVRLGSARVEEELSAEGREAVRSMLEQNGFELLDDRKKAFIERAKIAIIELIQNGDEHTLSTMVMSAYLSEKLQTDYTALSTLFSQMEGITIEKFSILQRIEKVKELMMYDELKLSEISARLGYSSVHHLSNQFKRVTGMTPTAFRQLRDKPRVGLDAVLHVGTTGR